MYMIKKVIEARKNFKTKSGHWLIRFVDDGRNVIGVKSYLCYPDSGCKSGFYQKINVYNEYTRDEANAYYLQLKKEGYEITTVIG